MDPNTTQITDGPLTAADLAAAVSENLDRPAMYGADPLTECLSEQCIRFSSARDTGQNVVPCSTLARWWLAVKNWL